MSTCPRCKCVIVSPQPCRRICRACYRDAAKHRMRELRLARLSDATVGAR